MGRACKVMGVGGVGERVGKRPREGGQQHKGSCAPSGPGDSHKGLSQSLCRTGLQGDSEAALQAVTQHTGAELGRPSALELPPEAGGPLPGRLGQSAPRNAPSFTKPPPPPVRLCPQPATHAAGMPGAPT